MPKTFKAEQKTTFHTFQSFNAAQELSYRVNVVVARKVVDVRTVAAASHEAAAKIVADELKLNLI